MKTVVFEQNCMEFEIKPHEMLGKYLALSGREIESWLLDSDQLIECVCPGCQESKSVVAFEKLGLTYRECVHCRSVYVTPRPHEKLLVDFYRNSRAARFWRENILLETKNMRREKVFKPRAQWLLGVVDRYYPSAAKGIVIGYHNDLLIQELASQEKHLFEMIVTNPIADIEYEKMNFQNVRICPENIVDVPSHGPVELFLAFDILDRCYDVNTVLSTASQVLSPGGLLLGSTVLGTGFDIQVLWDRSENTYPPDRLNLLSVEGLTTLYERHGFEAIEFSTPGMFDVEVVERAIRSSSEENWPRFIRYVLESRNEEAKSDLQEYLQRYRLSSFARFVLRKKS